MKACPNHRRKKVLAPLAVFACCLLAWSGCGRQRLSTLPPVTFPSVVTTQNGTAFYVKGLRIPGTFQELRLKQGDSLTWVPLQQVSVVRFSSPACDGYRPDGYRPALLFLTNGERLRGEVFTDFLIEGATDAGYWNMSLREVRSLEMGTE